jgi:ATP-dependent DNA helicase DinG
MSGTVVSAETMAEGLGLEEAGIEWATVELPMRFPVENRRVVFAPVVGMTKKQQDIAGTLDKMLRAVERVVARHEGENILIHTHTYKLARDVAEHLRADRYVETYTNSWDRERALREFKKGAANGGTVLVAPSMDRGIDLPGDLCRVQVIVKVPMASLGSRQVSERLRTPGGSDWYLANTVRTVMQMTGRAVRGMDDWAVCYILDSHFSKVLGDGKRRGMWPQWWLDALELGRMKEYG